MASIVRSTRSLRHFLIESSSTRHQPPLPPLLLTKPNLQRPYSTPTPSTPSPSFFPSQLSPLDVGPRTPKPPSPFHFTGRPSYNSTLHSLSTFSDRIRTILHKKGLIPRWDSEPTVEGTGLDLGFVQGGSGGLPNWKNQSQMSAMLSTRLKTSNYRRLTSLLSQLHQFIPFAKFLDKIDSETTSGGQELLSDGLEALLERFYRESGDRVRAVGLRKPSWEKELDKFGRAYGMGRRKESSAQVWILPADINTTAIPSSSEETTQPEPPIGRILINTLPLSHQTFLPSHQTTMTRPLVLTSTLGHFNVFALVRGGGKTGQAQAVALALSRALCNWERFVRISKEEKMREVEVGRRVEGGWKFVLKKADLLKRDPRMVERKKTGRPKARAGYTWVKR